MSLTVTLLWEKGEGQFKNGDILDALLSYQRAKQILLAESQSIYSIPMSSGSAQKIMGDIMQKLTTSIETGISTLKNNPALALGLSRGYNKLDVKKAYRRCALKYHPDKNQDCDSSCIFTAVQAAYEKLLHSAPVEYPPEIAVPVPPIPAPLKRKNVSKSISSNCFATVQQTHYLIRSSVLDISSQSDFFAMCNFINFNTFFLHLFILIVILYSHLSLFAHFNNNL